MDNANQSTVFLSDHLGSTSQLLDAGSGAPKARLDYKSYGRLEGDNANPFPANAYTYTGREDDGTGLMYYRARYYDPELEVFISEDPLGDAQRYVAGNPIKFKDPMGLDYVDLNLSFGLSFFGPTVGILIDDKNGISPYLGAGIMTPGVSGSIMFSRNNTSPGLWSGQLSGAMGIAGAAGIDQTGSTFGEAGFGSPGVSLTGYYTWPGFKLDKQSHNKKTNLESSCPGR